MGSCKTIWTVRDEDEISAKVRTPDASAREYVRTVKYVYVNLTGQAIKSWYYQIYGDQS